MKIEIVNLAVLFFFGIIYLVAFSKVQEKYFLKFGYPNRPLAVTIVLLGSIIAASVNMIHIAELAAAANRFFIGQSEVLKMLLFSFCFFSGMWIFSFALFHLSFLLVGFITPENESDELSKNNLEIAILHVVILVSLTFIISPALVKIAAEFIPYPEMPF
jgi:hypothetical protein